jgi:RHH-type proline utilization regulon transcriptional repressor/proline dehydrogenase/delta 1-pyrroline-5-carboxylate dehydrogenase
VSLRRLRLASSLTGVELVEADSRRIDDEAFLAGLRDGDRVRLVGEVSGVREQLVVRGIWHSGSPPSPSGRIELLAWTREQSISRTLHRHGRIP